jgi:hypothetical protein
MEGSFHAPLLIALSEIAKALGCKVTEQNQCVKLNHCNENAQVAKAMA